MVLCKGKKNQKLHTKKGQKPQAATKNQQAVHQRNKKPSHHLGRGYANKHFSRLEKTIILTTIQVQSMIRK